MASTIILAYFITVIAVSLAGYVCGVLFAGRVYYTRHSALMSLLMASCWPVDVMVRLAVTAAYLDMGVTTITISNRRL